MERVGFASSPMRSSPTLAAQPRQRRQHFLAFAAGNRRLDGAVIQRCQALSIKRTEGLHTGHKGRQQQGFYQTVVVAEGRLPGIIVRQSALNLRVARAGVPAAARACDGRAVWRYQSESPCPG